MVKQMWIYILSPTQKNRTGHSIRLKFAVLTKATLEAYDVQSAHWQRETVSPMLALTGLNMRALQWMIKHKSSPPTGAQCLDNSWTNTKAYLKMLRLVQLSEASKMISGSVQSDRNQCSRTAITQMMNPHQYHKNYVCSVVNACTHLFAL